MVNEKEKEMRFLFCGDRHWSDVAAIKAVMLLLKQQFNQYTIIEGEAAGADSIAKRMAIELELLIDSYPAQWGVYGKAAGPIRNSKMLKEGRPDAIFAFHYNLGESRGTRNMVEQAIRAGIPIWVCTEGQDKLAVFISELRKSHTVINI